MRRTEWSERTMNKPIKTLDKSVGSNASSSMLDTKNAEFWNELCGSAFARTLGIEDLSPESLRIFDAEYFRLYPYLKPYVLSETMAGKRVLEIGLGYGTLGQFLAEQQCDYHGLDIAPEAVAMMKHRLQSMGREPGDSVQVGSALENPHSDASLDYVYSIGCLHHTGNLPGCIDEIHRVLKPGGTAVVMLYHRYSYRQIMLRLRFRLDKLRDRQQPDPEERLRAAYDASEAGEAAPHTDYVSKRDVRRLFKNFSNIHIDTHNFDSMLRGLIPRKRLLGNIARILGLDLYIVARK